MFCLSEKAKKSSKALIVVAMTTASLLLSIVYLSAIFSDLIGDPCDTASIIITVLFDLAIFRFGSIPRNIAVVGIGGALGIFFGKSHSALQCSADSRFSWQCMT